MNSWQHGQSPLPIWPAVYRERWDVLGRRCNSCEVSLEAACQHARRRHRVSSNCTAIRRLS